MLESADTRFRMIGLPPSQLADASLHPRFWPHRPGIKPPQANAVAVGVSVPVIVNDGRWLVQCPSCRSAQFAAKQDQRFFCGECGNADHGGMWVAVSWPDAPDVIEAILDHRPITKKNWLPTDTVADLVAENVANHIPVPIAVTAMLDTKGAV